MCALHEGPTYRECTRPSCSARPRPVGRLRATRLAPSGEPTVDFPPQAARAHESLAREDEEDEESGLAQQDPAHAVLGVLGQDQGGPPRESRQIRTGEGWVLV